MPTLNSIMTNQPEWQNPANKTWYGAKVTKITRILVCPNCGATKNDPLVYATGSERTSIGIQLLDLSLTCPDCQTKMEYKTITTTTYYDNEGNILDEEPQPDTTKQIFNKIRDFFYEEVPQSHEETDKDGNTITVEDGTIRQMNWFKVGACTTSITLMILGAIIMLIRKHK